MLIPIPSAVIIEDDRGIRPKFYFEAYVYVPTQPYLVISFFKNWPTLASFLFIFVLFNNNFTEKL